MVPFCVGSFTAVCVVKVTSMVGVIFLCYQVYDLHVSYTECSCIEGGLNVAYLVAHLLLSIMFDISYIVKSVLR